MDIAIAVELLVGLFPLLTLGLVVGSIVAFAATGTNDGEESHQEVQPAGAVGDRKDGAASGRSFNKIGLDLFFPSEHTIILRCVLYEIPPDQHLADMVSAKGIWEIGQ